MTNRNICIYVLDFIIKVYLERHKKNMLNIRLDLFEHYIAIFSFDVGNNRTEFRSEKGKII